MQIHEKNPRIRQTALTKVVQNGRFSGDRLISRRNGPVLKFRYFSKGENPKLLFSLFRTCLVNFLTKHYDFFTDKIF